MAKRNLSLRQKNRIQSIQERRRERAIAKNSMVAAAASASVVVL